VNLARWSARPLGTRALVVVVAGALIVLVLAFRGAMRSVQSVAYSDVTLYQNYGSKMLDGAMPYRDFKMEYPPGAAVMFILPATRLVEGANQPVWVPPNAAARRYYRGFTSLVLLLVAAMVVLTALTLAAMRRSARTMLLALAVVAFSPLMIGQVVPERFDVLPAALTAATLAAAIRGHHRLSGVMLGLGAAAKIYPAILLPVLVIAVIRRRGVREAILVAGAAIIAAAAVFVPFAIASPSGTWDSLRSQFRGGLQIESLASSVLVTTNHAGRSVSALGLPSPSELTTQPAPGGLTRLVLAGPGVRTAEIVMPVLLIAALLFLLVSQYRSRRDPREDLLRYSAAAVTILLALGTVLSPQYVVWLIPLVPLVSGRSGTVATLFFVTAAALTNVWIPNGYFHYQDGLPAGPASLLLARNLALLATAITLVVPVVIGKTEARSSA
jgi:glycosyl transferase family 87